MSKQLRLLIVEDSEDDTLLLLRFLRQSGYNISYERVDHAGAMRAALVHSEWDVIIADYNMPRFSGTQALEVLQASGLDLPFIIVSAVIGEEAAVAAMRAGAHDYLRKDNLARLVPAIEREIHEAASRRARRQAERRAYQFSRALEQSAGLMMIADPDGRIQYVNLSFSRVTGYAAAEVIGQTIEWWQSTTVPSENTIALSSAIRAGLQWQGEIELVKKTGKHYWASVVISPIRDENGHLTDFLIAQEDITERKELEAELQHYAAHLEQIVEQRTSDLMQTNQQLNQEINERRKTQAELMEARDRALESLRVKNQILANMDHETRTPLAVMNSTIDLLRRAYYGPITDQQAQALTTILEEAKYLLNFMDNLLDVAELEANTTALEPTSFAPSELIDDIEKKFSYVAQAKGLNLKCELTPAMPAMLQGDIERLRRILFNLVDNAIRFTEQGAILVRAFQQDDSHWVLCVADNGPGITADAQPHIFEPFWQADLSSTRKTNRGVGLGLSVVRKLVTLMGGEVRVSSDSQSGTAFTVILPLLQPSITNFAEY